MTTQFVVPARPGYIGWRNRFLDSINVYNYGLRIQTLLRSAKVFKSTTQDWTLSLIYLFLKILMYSMVVILPEA
jgi:hypothetical protein